MAKADKEKRDMEIRAAIEAVAATGEDPTNELVRTQLGGRGSFSTISPIVRAWKAERTNQPPPPANDDTTQQTEVPAVVQQTLNQVSTLLKQLTELVPGEIDAAVNVERRRARAELDAERETLNKQVQSLRTEIAAHLQVLKTVEDEGQAFEEQIEELKTNLITQKSVHDKELEAQQARFDAHLAETRADHARELDRRDKQHTERLAEIRTLNEGLEREKKSLEQEKIDLSKSHVDALAEQQVRFDKSITDMRSDHQQTIDHLTEQHDKLIAEMRKANENLEQEIIDLSKSHANALAEQQARFDKSIADMRSDYQTSAKRTEQVLADLQKRLDGAEEARRELEQTIADLSKARHQEE